MAATAGHSFNRGQMGKYNPEVAALMKFKQYINDHLMIL